MMMPPYPYGYTNPSKYARRKRASNPELLIVGNPGRRSAMRRRRRRSRSRRRNSPLTIRVKGRGRRYKSLVRQYGVKKASMMWRKAKRKRHGYSKTGATCRTKRRRKKARNRGRGRRRVYNRKRKRKSTACRYVRIGKRRHSWKGLVKKFGVKKASRLWRKRRKVARNKGRRRRVRRRRFRRRNR